MLRVAEDRFLHGHLLSRWVTDYIDLEESLAVGSIAQEELAHAATLIELAGLDERARDGLIFERPLQEWRPTAIVTYRLEDWPAAVLRGYLLATVGVTGSLLLSGARDPELRSAGQVMVAEQQLHVTHWERWLSALGNSDRTAGELRARGADVLPLARDVFGEPAFDESSGAAAHAAWLEAISPVLGDVGVPVDLLRGPPIPRSGGATTELVEILDEVRAERTGAGDGVRGLYR